eukprot:2706640-Rhodomonas_salina.1
MAHRQGYIDKVCSWHIDEDGTSTRVHRQGTSTRSWASAVWTGGVSGDRTDHGRQWIREMIAAKGYGRR